MPTLQPEVSADCTAFENRLSEDVDSWSVWKWQEPFRTHLGISGIGEDCMRALWYGFRWVKAEKRDGRMYRLLERGKLEEPRIFEILSGIGFTVHSLDENGKQYRYRSVAGHYGGSIDAVLIAPERYNLGNRPILLSVKTSGTGSAFKKYDEQMQIANAMYWAQENAYGHGFGIDLALWAVVNKNDDSIAFRLQKLDPEYGRQLEQKAARVVFTREAPDRISKSPAFKKCSYCNFKGICHAGAEIERNCRSCYFAQPTTEPDAETGKGNWFCGINGSVIPLEVIPNGCASWKPVTKNLSES